MKKLQVLYIGLPIKHKIMITALSIILMLILFIPSEKATASRQSDENSYQVGKRYQLEIPHDQNINQELPPLTQQSNEQSSEQINDKKSQSNVEHNNKIEQDLSWQTVKVNSGDSLGKIFKRLGFSAKTTHQVITAKGTDSELLKNINVGDTIRLATNSEKVLVALEYPLSRTETLFINLIENDDYSSHKETKSIEIRESFAHGIIKSSFWNAGIEAGLESRQIIALANVFGWDIDFALDIRSGDSFHVIFENHYIDGEFIGTGKILAAEFNNQNEPFQAIRFSDDEFYTPDGKSMRKAFLRAPVNFKYISSNFKPKRFHPIQKRWKAHRGTDYRANTGTPVVAAGNGKVTDSTFNKYNGNYVFIQHGNGIITKYLHFSKRAVKKGDRVKQGQVIGYVGTTGMSEAPHLHYEFLLNGVHRNPRTVALPDAQPIDKKFKDKFSLLASQRLIELSGSKQALLSMQNSPNINQMLSLNADNTADE